MERLTNRDDYMRGEIAVFTNSKMADIYEVLTIQEIEELEKAIDKLADYEDAEENGTLIKLPCKVGDTVYRLYSNFLNNKVAILPQTIVQIRKGINIRGDSKIGVVVDYNEHYTLDEFDETFFLTREAAEAALKERESE